MMVRGDGAFDVYAVGFLQDGVGVGAEDGIVVLQGVDGLIGYP